MKVTQVEFQRARRGWVCTVFFWVSTRRQFTVEDHWAKGEGRNPLAAFYRAYLTSLKVKRYLREQPGEFALD